MGECIRKRSIKMYQALPIALLICHYGEAVMVSVEQGVIRGEQLMTVTRDISYSSFKGIPYAAPPVGKLRFQPPQPAAYWEGVRNAKQHGNICTQVDFITQQFLNSSEDCLYLNVYTPNVMPSSAMAVMVFIHGGGYQSGSGNDDNFGPDFFISQNVVLVTINYRLDALGYMSLRSKEVPGNAGMKDQVPALKWVQRNIAQFGGNPQRVTIFGTTTGGISCLLHAISPMSKGLFSRVLAMTGVPYLDIGEEFQSVRRGFTLGKIMGYETVNATALFEFFQNEPAYKFVNTKPNVIIAEKYINNLAKMFPFGPAPEKDFGQERFLTESPLASLLKRKVNDVDIMIGYSTNEGMAGIYYFEQFLVDVYNRYPELLNPRKFLYDFSAVEYMPLADAIERHYFRGRPISLETMFEFVTYQSDRYEYQILRYMRDASYVYERNKFLYRFSGVSERNVYSRLGANYGLTGAGQRDIEMYLFHANRQNLTVEVNSDSYRIIKQITTLFANYAKYGNPTPEPVSDVSWDQYNATTESFLDIGLRLTREVQPEPKVIRFWKKIYQLAGVPFYNFEEEE